MANNPQQKNAYYRIYNGATQEWDIYFFKTTAEQVILNGNYAFITANTSINSVPFTLTYNSSNNTTSASLTLTGYNFNWYAGETKPTTNYLTSAENIQSALQALDTQLQIASTSIPSGVLTTSNFGDNDYYPNLEDIEEGVADSVVQTGYLVKKVNGWELDMLGTSIHKNYTTSVTQDSDSLVTSGGVYTAISTAISSLPTPMQFKGTVGTNGTISWDTLNTYSPSTHEGWMYKVITAGYVSHDVQAQVGDAVVSDGTNWIVIPSGDESFTDTWRQINVNGSQLLASGISTGVLNFVNGDNITFTGSGNNITIGVASGYSIPSTTQQNSWTAKQDALGYTPVNKAGDTMTGNLTIQGTSSNPAELNLTESALNLAVLTLTGDYIQAKGASAKLNFPAILADQTFATQEWATGIFARVTVSTGSTEPSYTGKKTGDIWIN